MISENYINKLVRSATILTSAYVAGEIITDAQSYNQLTLHCAFTIGSLTDAQIKIEFSWDGVNYYQETFSTVATGVSTDIPLVHLLGDDCNLLISVPISARYIKISAIGTGTVTKSSLAINAILSKI